MSEAARYVMIRNVSNSILIHHMSSFKLPDATVNKVNSSQQRFCKNKKSNKGRHVVTWRRANHHKVKGGLGFRDMHTFNRALLAKSAWKLRTYMTSIMTKSLGTKYFPYGEIFNFKKKYNATWSWNNISSELSFIQNFSCWSLGDDASISSIWKHRWIPEIQSLPKPKEDCIIQHNYNYVNQLFQTDSETWNVSLLNELFDQDTVAHILSISIHKDYEDKLVWLLEKGGNFSVKSAYRKMYEKAYILQSVGPMLQKIYTSLWKLHTLPRIQQFLWKATSSLLSTKDVLEQSIVGDDTSCSLCGQHMETTAHLIMRCDTSRLIWFEAAGCTSVNQLDLSAWICSWFDDLHSGKISELEVIKRAIIAWCTCTERCEFFFQNKSLNPDNIIHRAKTLIEEYVTRKPSMSSTTKQVNRRDIHWISPPTDFLKINCDDSFHNLHKSGCIGLLIRNAASIQQGARCIHLRNIRSAEQAECMRLWEDVHWPRDLKLERVHFELDAHPVVDAVNKDHASLDWRLSNYMKEIKTLFNVFTYLRCYYVPQREK